MKVRRPGWAMGNGHATARGLALAGLILHAAAGAAQYPSRPVRMIALNPPGGVSDTLARAVGENLSKRLGQPFVIDNRVGAGGIVGSEIAARSAPDGHTLLMGFVGNLAINPGLYRKLPYDPVRDFAPVSLVGRSPQVLVVHPGLGTTSVRDLVALAKSRTLHFSSSGVGNGNHLAAELFRKSADIRMIHVPYKGGPPALTAVIAGEVSLMFSNALPALPQIRAGRVKALAVTTEKRLPLLSDVPTMVESGLSQFVVTTWFGVVAPAATPLAIVKRLNDEINALLAEAPVRDRLTNAGLLPSPSTPREFGALILSEKERWLGIIRESGARAD